MKRIIALAGNPNCGKTLLFNELTGANQHVGNWPGVTVERKTGTMLENEDIEILDLPGVYSLSPYSPEERVTRHYLLEQKPDLIVNIIDATNLERNLYLTHQLLETGRPVLIVLNMIDLAFQEGIEINVDKLSRALGCPVIAASALKLIGLAELREALTATTLPSATAAPAFSTAIEEALKNIQTLTNSDRWTSVKLLENDPELISTLTPQQRHDVAALRLGLENKLDDDIDSIIAAGRYEGLEPIIKSCRREHNRKAALASRIDAVLTHRVLGLLIFAAVMFGIYFLSITTIGTWGTDWANDVLFGPIVGGWLGGFLGSESVPLESLVQLSAVLAMILVFPVTLRRLHDLNLNGSWLYLALAPFLLEYMFPHMPEVMHQAVMYALYAANLFLLLACFCFRGNATANAYGRVPQRLGLSPLKLDGRANRREYALWFVIMSAVSLGIASLGYLQLDCDGQIQDLVSNGIVAGVGAVLGFLPQMAVLFLLLALLEDCGYMARVAFMMDRIFRSLGLSGKSFIPLLVSMGCGVPGVMATRTIENEKDRRMSIMLTTFIPCGAKLPIIALLAALIGSDALISTVAYFAGVGSVILSGIILRKTHMFAGSYTPFVMELPPYHMPNGVSINLRAMERCKAFARKAGTVIFLASAAVWFTQSYTWKLSYLNTSEEPEAIEQSMLADIGHQMAPLFGPLGWNDWKPAVASVTGLVAKETVIGTFGVLYKAEEGGEEEAFELTPSQPKFNAMTALTVGAWQLDPAVREANAAAEAPESEDEALAAKSGDEAAEEAGDEEDVSGLAANIQAAGTFTLWSGLSFMLFNLLCAPCFAACGAIRREMNSARWTWFAIGYMCVWAYIIALLVYQYGNWWQTGVFATGQLAAVVLSLGLLYMLLRPMPKRS
ncbi:MAG TPA: 50S ribosome-binding GTPase [Candidatus Akkermansia intestinigallinarum]|uniref:Fe(2+) transporter FeoB n=1 Tax=Candidatus Akkermansia intestinigallinarum TaxID=2838431 RepID=A0A9D2AI37_9BACT|nr:50S ribosome-binding GTPase [Candidatus Akkermansia intestinigallinarum]